MSDRDPGLDHAPGTDPTTEEFWAAARERVLLLQRCTCCSAAAVWPRPICARCSATTLENVPASGNGIIYAITTVRRPLRPDHTPPYTVALVDLDEGARMLTRLLGRPGRIGDRVTLDWVPREDLPPLPVFRLPAPDDPDHDL